ncbi:hypothetical protein [Kitasatospora griseola]|uniref:hypothetical protein n=1 Tax=Kitasatospora griseola TaxID=2064 RepID=UPI00344A3BBF
MTLTPDPANPGPPTGGTPEWQLHLTATGEHRPMPDLITALIAAAQHSARAAQPGTAHTNATAGLAVVLHHGEPWTPEEMAASGAVRPMLWWYAHCSVCGDPAEEEFGAFATVTEAADNTAELRWSRPAPGWLVCDSDSPDHQAARAAAPQPLPLSTGQQLLPAAAPW